jgi:hypothetical protein
MGTVLEEADESAYWLELLSDAGKVDPVASRALRQEALEVVAIAVTSLNPARRQAAGGS